MVPIKLVAISSRSSSGDDTPQFEHLLAALSSRFAALHLDNLAQVLSSALEQVCVALNVDCGSVLEFSEEGRVRGCCTRIRPGIDDVHVDVEPDSWRWLVGRLLDRQPVVISRLQDLPMEALGEREYTRRTGLSSMLALPVAIGDRCTCALVLSSYQRHREWHGPVQDRARLLAEIIGNALQRSRQEAALRSSLAEIQRLNSRLTADNVCLKEDIKTFHDFDEIVGESDVMRDALERLAQVAPLNCSALLLGETGTGKELFARALHERSRRRSRALVRVNCAALPPSLIESELFGHEKGAFTGAVSLRQGRFELADGGTVFLDEIGDLPLDMQGKLLRLQEGEFERVGSSRTRRVDVRVIAATHHDLETAVAEGAFRADLYIGSACFQSTCRHCVTAARTFHPWCGSSFTTISGNWGAASRKFPTRSCRPSAITTGRATSGSSKTWSSGPSFARPAIRCSSMCRSVTKRVAIGSSRRLELWTTCSGRTSNRCSVYADGASTAMAMPLSDWGCTPTRCVSG